MSLISELIMHLGQHLLFYASKPLTHFYKFENVDLVILTVYQCDPRQVLILLKPKKFPLLSPATIAKFARSRSRSIYPDLSRHHTANKVSST